MEPPNNSDNGEETILRPNTEADEPTRLQHRDDPDATQMRMPTDDATIIGSERPSAQQNNKQTGTQFNDINSIGSLDTARLQKSPIPAHLKSHHSKTGIRIAVAAVTLIAWVGLLWWVNRHKLETDTPHPNQTVIEKPINSQPPTDVKPLEETSSASIQGSTTSSPANTPPPEATSTVRPFAIISKNILELTTLAETAIKQNNLEPASDNRSATGLLIQMNLVDPKNEHTLEVRRLLAEAHLLQSKQARTNGNWDAAEHHTEEAWHVRRNDSYLTPP